MNEIDQLCINTLRMLSADAVQKANSGHPGMPMGDAAMAYVLWTRCLKHNPRNPFWQNRDRFVLSAGHGSMLLYSLLHLTGHDISLNDIQNFRQWDSKAPGHPEYCLSSGIEMTTGPLGQGFATGVGMAMAQKYLAEMFNKPGYPIFDYKIYGIAGDGCLMEGISSEAASLAGHLRLGNMIYLYSDNKITIDGSTDLAFTEDVSKRFEAYGWHVQKIDGNNLEEVGNALENAKKELDRPSIIVARTHIGTGSPNKCDSHEAHGSPLGEEELKLTRENLGWKYGKFEIPPSALEHFRKAVDTGAKEESAWNAMFAEYAGKYPELAKQYKAIVEKDFSYAQKLPVFKPTEPAIATRAASGKVLNAIAGSLPQLLGGSADLAPSNNTFLKGFPEFTRTASGKNIHFGVREHAMGAALNGMALSNMLIPYGGTFLVFADYMLPTLRLSALMRANSIFIFTHDSIGLGEDGPTHQPIEQLTHLRSIPGLVVLRPADANETAISWKIAIERKKGPVALILTRQNLPIYDREKYAPLSNVEKGGYVLADCAGRPEIIFIASGSEVELAMAAHNKLAGEGIKTRVVNMISCELFNEQSLEYRNSVLPPECESRLAIEAGASMSWYRYVGLKGAVVGLDRFGESAPAKVLFEKFGFTVDNVVAKAKALKKT